MKSEFNLDLCHSTIKLLSPLQIVLRHLNIEIMNKINLLWSIMFVLVSKLTFCQSVDPFENLNLSSITSGVFLPTTPGFEYIPNGLSYTETDFSFGNQVVFEIGNGRLDNGLFPQIEQIQEVSNALKDELAAVPIVVTDIRYHDFVSDAMESGLLGFENGQYVDLSEPEDDIFEEKRAVSCFHDREFYTDPVQRFIFPSCLQITNIQSETFLIQADFDDGQGWMPVLWDQLVEVVYPDASEDRYIKVKFLRDEELLKSGFHLRSGGGQAGSLELNPSPWPSINSTHPWRISAIHGDHLIQANAYTLTSPDGIFDKPFIFVEGIDFGDDISPKRNGTFGWYEFSSGQSVKYSFLALMPTLIEQLQEEGYDIVLLDFKQGADFIEWNSTILQHLLELVNEYKVGNAGNVVVGASMGGQVSRHALRTMELEGTKHCCRLWISMDSPHKGAYIPAGIQGLLVEMAGRSENAQESVNNLMKPAAQQMLRYNRFANSDLHDAWYNDIDELGYPEECRNIAIANGNISGVPLNYAPSSKIIDYSWSYFGNEIIGFDVFALPGNLIHEESNGTTNVISEVRIPPPGLCLDPACLAAELLGLTINPKIKKVNTTSLVIYDVAPGGKYNTTEQLVKSLNDYLDKYSFVPQINTDDYQKYHSFISTASALGLGDEYTMSNIGQVLIENPELIPFDAFYAPASANQIHTQVTAENIAFVMGNVLSGEGLLSEELNASSPNNGTYNLCVEENNILPAVTIHDGAKVYINGNFPSHFADGGDIVPEVGSSFYAKTAYCGSEVIVGENGMLILGDSNGNKGMLEIREGSSLTIDGSGILLVHAGSELRVKSGAYLNSNNGHLRVENGARIVIEEGAEFHLDGDEAIGLIGSDAILEIHGDVYIHDNSTLLITHPNVQSGKILIYGAGASFYGGAFAQIDLVGDSPTDKIIEVMPNGRFKCEEGFGSLTVQHGLVYIHPNAIFENRNHGVFDKVVFEAQGNDASFLTRFDTQITDCTFDNVAITAELLGGILEVDNSTFVGEDCKIAVTGQGYTIRNSTFEDCRGIVSNALTLSSTIDNCHFDFHNQGDNCAIKDNSDVSIFVTDCFIQRCGTGLFKIGGELYLGCTEIGHNSVRGLYLGQGCKAYLDESHDVGRNKLVQNRINIEMGGVELFEVVDGNNTIRNASLWNVYGLIQGECTNCDNVTLDVSGNNWSLTDYTPLNALPGEPDQDEIQLWIYNFDCMFQQPPELGCPVDFHDNSPILNTECGGHDEPNQAVKKSLDTGFYIAIYPNPSSTVFTILAGIGSDSWQVTDLSGRCVSKGNLLEGRCQISVSDWSKGIYYLSIEGFSHERLVVN
jgi:hypothetical protein